jgi:hypothetical protein
MNPKDRLYRSSSSSGSSMVVVGILLLYTAQNALAALHDGGGGGSRRLFQWSNLNCERMTPDDLKFFFVHCQLARISTSIIVIVH